ncbi:MAG TPA: SH3 domain-containing protein [Pyrinomonadaceae bacterium]|nr:SH3 domain-containing protein [Chloracidobacterium sp.]HBE83271.1 hypothetical protein [Blastocatellia bacterium]HRJ88337.1 SH3 domain-containing protein [Pyrinomonadaceae bacterium]HRK51837.1 SH3 domain-containing protein [Pyrinomonadaceae bacterium]
MNKKISLIATVVLIAASFLTAAGQERFVRPVDEAAKDKSFLAFRIKLIAAAERKDLDYVVSIMDKDIKFSFGDTEGVEDFREFWKDADAFWAEFIPVIKNGGSFSPPAGVTGRMFMAPYTFSKWPDQIDAFEHAAIIGSNVNLRDKASTDGKVLGRLSYNVVKVTESVLKGEKAEWHKVRTLGGKTGWVKAEYVRSSIDYRAGFEKKGGVWKMVFFVAGD